MINHMTLIISNILQKTYLIHILTFYFVKISINLSLKSPVIKSLILSKSNMLTVVSFESIVISLEPYKKHLRQS